ncbi:MAG: hypothetical protein HRT89_11915 [Lentisphaeria bacterium]|nr:hypothetical protein [Lentisphaeria bacterium]
MSMTGMLQRSWHHDYCAPSFYMITIVTEPRRQCLSQVTEDAEVVLSPIGELVKEAWNRTNEVYPNVKACEFVVMPDHFHGILRVQEQLKRPMGHLIKAFKRVSRQECVSRGLLPPLNAKPSAGASAAAPASSVSVAAPATDSSASSAPATESPSLWQEGFQDSILLRKGQLQAMVNYIADNPRRLAAKRANPELFTVVSEEQVCPGLNCSIIGNRFLLNHPLKRQIQISRGISSTDFADLREELLYVAEHGTVLVSPCISPGEKEIARAVMEMGKPLIVIVENGFTPFYKPPGRYFDACADGLLLMIAPFPHHRQKQTITRDQCLIMNQYAASIVAMG